MIPEHLREAPLYEQLATVSRHGQELRRNIGDARRILTAYGEDPGHIPSPEWDTEARQRFILEEWKDHPVVSRAAKGTESVTGAYLRLNRVNTRWLHLGRRLPRRLNQEQNRDVESLSEVLGPLNHLRSNGLWRLDNPLSSFLVGAVPGALIGLGISLPETEMSYTDVMGHLDLITEYVQSHSLPAIGHMGFWGAAGSAITIDEGIGYRREPKNIGAKAKDLDYRIDRLL